MMVRWLTRYGRRDEGSMTLLGIYVLAGGLLISAFAIDFAYLLSARTQLQVAADSAAHAALYFRETNTEEQSKLKAVEMAQHDMPASQYGAVLEAEDVEFGSWDYASKTFTPASGSMEAVRVRPSRIEAKGNAVAVFLFRLLDRPEWDVAAQAIFVTFQPHCFREGFVAQGVVDIQSNNGFADGFCLHSNTYVSVNQNNTFEPGTVVSMPDSNDIDMPRSGFEKNEGLQAALRNGFYRLRMLLKLDEIYDSLYFGYGDHVPDYITASVPIVLSDTKLGVADFEQGRIHRLNCGGKTINIDGGITLRNIVIITDCDIKFGNDLTLADAVIFTRSTAAKSINSSSGLRIGEDDGCAEGGGAQIITYGGVDVAADMHMYGGQIIALGDVAFAANANGIQGASILAKGTISGTSNMDMGFCGTGMDDNFEAQYFRLAL